MALWLSFFVLLTQSNCKNIWFVSAEYFETIHHHPRLVVAEENIHVFSAPPSVIYSKVNESVKKALCHWKNERVMGQWLTCCLGPRDHWGTGGLAAASLPFRTVTLFMDSPGCAWACDLWLSIWCCQGIVVDAQEDTQLKTVSLYWDHHGGNHGNWHVVKETRVVWGLGNKQCFYEYVKQMKR